MFIKPVGSIFNLSYNDIKLFTPRLKPQIENTQSLYGCLSVSGFLAADEGLLERGYKDLKTVEAKRTTYVAIAKKAEALFLAAMNGNSIIAGRFKVTLFSSNPVSQFCPFSSRGDVNIHMTNSANGACGESTIDFLIENIYLNRSILLNELHIHLIRDHHFFEGDVQYRVDPRELIEILEIVPEINFKSSLYF